VMQDGTHRTGHHAQAMSPQQAAGGVAAVGKKTGRSCFDGALPEGRDLVQHAFRFELLTPSADLADAPRRGRECDVVVMTRLSRTQPRDVERAPRQSHGRQIILRIYPLLLCTKSRYFSGEFIRSTQHRVYRTLLRVSGRGLERVESSPGFREADDSFEQLRSRGVQRRAD